MFVDLSAYFDYRIERSHRVLENHRYFLTPDVGHFAHRKIEQIFTEKVDVSGSVNIVSEVQAHDGSRQDGLAATTFANDSHCLTRLQGKAHSIDRPEATCADCEVGAEVVNGQ